MLVLETSTLEIVPSFFSFAFHLYSHHQKLTAISLKFAEKTVALELLGWKLSFGGKYKLTQLKCIRFARDDDTS